MYNQKSLAVGPPSPQARPNASRHPLLKEMNTPSYQRRPNSLAAALLPLFGLTDAPNIDSSLQNAPRMGAPAWPADSGRVLLGYQSEKGVFCP